MNQIQVIEYKGQRILTTAQLAEAYGTDNRRISENFQRNQERYKEGKHFFALGGDEKREFLNHTQIADGSKNASVLYLWTEKGAWLHAKSLNTDEAWDAYELLVDDYYTVKETNLVMKPMSTEDMIILQAQSVKELKQRVDQTVERQDRTEDEVRQIRLVVDNEVWLTEAQKREIQELVGKRVYTLQKEGYEVYFQSVYSALKRHFGVSKYDKIPRKDFAVAAKFVSGWYPSIKSERILG